MEHFTFESIRSEQRGLLEVRLAGHRVQAFARLERVAQIPVLQVLVDQPQQLVFHVLVHDQTRGSGTVLIPASERTSDNVLGHFVKVFAGVHDRSRILSTQLQDGTLVVGLAGLLQEQATAIYRRSA